MDRQKSENKDSMLGLKRIYELSIKQLQEALDIQSKSSKEEVDKLKGHIEGLEKKYARDFDSYGGVSVSEKLIKPSSSSSSSSSPLRKQLRVKDKKGGGGKSDRKGNKNTSTTVNDSFASQASLLYDQEQEQTQEQDYHNSNSRKEDSRLLQVALNETADELRRVQRSLFAEREKHEREMQSVRDNFRQLKLAQEGNVILIFSYIFSYLSLLSIYNYYLLTIITGAVNALETELQDLRNSSTSSSHPHPRRQLSVPSHSIRRDDNNREEQEDDDYTRLSRQSQRTGSGTAVNTTFHSVYDHEHDQSHDHVNNNDRDQSTLQLLEELNRRWQNNNSNTSAVTAPANTGSSPSKSTRKPSTPSHVTQTQAQQQTEDSVMRTSTSGGSDSVRDLHRDINSSKVLVLEKENSSLQRLLEDERRHNVHLTQQVQVLHHKLSQSRYEHELMATEDENIAQTTNNNNNSNSNSNNTYVDYDKIQSFQFDSNNDTTLGHTVTAAATDPSSLPVSDKQLAALSNKITKAISSADQSIKTISSYEYATLFQTLNQLNAAATASAFSASKRPMSMSADQSININTSQNESIYNMFNDVRSVSVKEITRLKHLLLSTQKLVWSQRADIESFTSLEVDLRTQIQHMKEEVARKAKFIVSLKQNKEVDTQTLEKLKQERIDVEDNCKRAQKQATVKENLIKDLRVRIECLEKDLKLAQDKETVVTDITAAKATITELQTKYVFYLFGIVDFIIY